MPDKVLAIKGGKLIDGTGRPTDRKFGHPDRGRQIQGRWQRARAVPIPPDAEVVDVAGQDRDAGLHGWPWPSRRLPRRALSPSRHHQRLFHQHLPGRPLESGAEAGNRARQDPRAAHFRGGPGDRRRACYSRGRVRQPDQPRQHHRKERRRGASGGAQKEGAGLRPDQAQRVSGIRPGESRRRRGA